MEVGSKVKITGTNDIWEGKSGTIVEVLDEGKCGVSVDFKEGKKVTQYFDEANLEVEAQESLKEDVNKGELKEMVTYDQRKEALAKYLGVDVSEIQDGYDTNYFEVNDEEWRVLDDQEADDAVYDYIEEFIRECGIEGFTPNFQDWIYNNAIDFDFDDYLREDTESYVNDIEEEDSNGFDNRLIEEMYDEGILTDDDFEVDEDGEVDYFTLKDEVNFEDKKEEFIQSRVDDAGDAAEWFRFNFGDDGLKGLLESGAATLDTQAIVDECISWDGRGHNLSSYDGSEVELENDLYGYRVN